MIPVVRWSVLSLFLVAISSASLFAVEPPELPTDPQLWIGSPPVTLKQLAGKGVVLTFFEEDCPKCRAEMQARVELSRKYANEPVFFIGINSGSTRQEIETYVQQVGVTWPVILDPDRSLEKAMGIGEISLQNIYQFRYINSDGELKRTNSFDFETMAKDALIGASWSVSPDKIPASLKGAWSAIELKNFSAAASTLSKAVSSRDDEVQSAAKLLMEEVEAEIEAAYVAADIAATSDDPWLAYNLFQKISQQFAGYKQAERATMEAKKLSSTPAVKLEITLSRKIDLVVQSLNKRGPSKTAIANLEKIASENPNTTAAKRATELLEQITKQTSEAP
ncbi:MAG: TlpA disulfide reductase family protein [Planctomycetaceae bacterium]